MSKGFRVTYELVTDASAADGEAAETGFVLPGNWHVDPTDPGSVTLSLREALALCSPQENCGHWFAEADERINYRTGETEQRSLHPPGTITPSSYRRLCRLFNIR